MLARATLIVIFIVTVITAWLVRIDVTPTSNPLIVVVKDRWSGVVYSCQPGNCRVAYSPWSAPN